MRLLFGGIGLFALGVLLAGPVRPLKAAAPAEVKKLHILLVFDTDEEDLAPSLKIDEWRMRRVLKDTIPEDRRSITVFKGEDVTPARILAYYRDLKVDANDGLLFFYGGHGVTSVDKKHYFDLSCNEKLYRDDLRKAMEAKKTPLVVLLTDCCSTPEKIAQLRPRAVAKSESRTTKAIHPTVRCLLFQSRGTVDVTAATDNASWSDNEKGGLFTRSLCMQMVKSVKAFDLDRDGFVSWKEFFPQLQKETEIVFSGWSRELRARGATITGSGQKPHPFRLGDEVVVESQDFAVLSIENAADEVLVYRWRWAGTEEWTEARLARGVKKVHFVVLTPGQQALPYLEAEIKGRATAKLKASKWTGKGEPTFADGDRYRIRLRKK